MSDPHAPLFPATPSVPTTALEPLESVTLTGERVRLEPLGPEHVEGLQEAVADGEIWRIPFAPHVPAPAAMEEAVRGHLDSAARGLSVPWAVVDRRGEQERVVGLTTYMNIARTDRGLELGNTFLAGSTHGTGVNAEMKLLLLEHAFETVGCVRVEFRVHSLNAASRRAVERLGATPEGILRNHRILPDGTVRHTAVYSILLGEWPGIRRALEHRIGR